MTDFPSHLDILQADLAEMRLRKSPVSASPAPSPAPSKAPLGPKPRLRPLNRGIVSLVALGDTRGLGLGEIAQILGASKESVVSWARGNSTPNPDNIALIEKTFGVPALWWAETLREEGAPC